MGIRVTRIKAAGIRATRIKATGIRAMRIRIQAIPIPIRGIRIKAMAARLTWIRGHLRRAPTATTLLILTDVHRTVTMGLAGSRTESLSASDLGGAGADAGSMVDAGSTVGAATTVDAAMAGGLFLDAVGTVTLTAALGVPTVAGVVSVAVDVPTVVDAVSVAAGVPTVEVDVLSVAADVVPVAAGMATEAVDIVSVAADVATAEAVPMVVGVGRVLDNTKLSRPTAFAVGRLVSW